MLVAAVMDVVQSEDRFNALVVAAMSGLLDELGDRLALEQGLVEVEQFVSIAELGRKQGSRLNIETANVPPVARANGRDDGECNLPRPAARCLSDPACHDLYAQPTAALNFARSTAVQIGL